MVLLCAIQSDELVYGDDSSSLEDDILGMEIVEWRYVIKGELLGLGGGAGHAVIMLGGSCECIFDEVASMGLHLIGIGLMKVQSHRIYIIT